MKALLATVGRGLLRILPRDFHDRFGDDIADYFREGTREARDHRGVPGVVFFWLKSAADVLRVAASERIEERSMQKEKNAPSRFSDLGMDIRYAIRGLRKTPGFTAVALLTLALGIGATTAMFSVADAALGKALPYPDAHKLVLGRATFSGEVNPWVAFPDYMDYRDQAQSLASLATITGRSNLVTITGNDEPEQVGMAFVTANIFHTLGVPPAMGSTFTIDELAGDGAGQVVISHGFWQRWFGGSADVVGQSLLIEGSPATVMGVMPAGFRFMFDTDLWVPPWPGNSDPFTRRYHNWLVVGRLGPEASLESARAEVALISAQLEEAYPDSNTNKALQLDVLHTALAEGYRPALLILLGAIGLVLLIACSNVASLLMARGSTRRSEMALKAALGAGKVRLTRQLLVECLVLALAAGGVGVVLAIWLQDLILGFISMDLLGIERVGLSSTMLGTALFLSLVTVLIFGIFPSLLTSRIDPAEDLKEGSRGSSSGGGVRYRSGLVVLQVALSLILLVGSGLLLRSFARLSGVDPGFRVENLLTATVMLPNGRYSTAEERIQFFESLKESVEGLPGVEAVTMVNQLPILHPAGNVAIWAPERPPEANTAAPWADRRVVFPGYFETMEIPVLEGRALDETDVAEAPPVIVLSRRTVEMVFPEENAVGRQVAVDVGSEEPGYFEVVGVVEDHQLSSLNQNPRPAMFFAYAQMPWNVMRFAVVASGDPLTLVRPIQEKVWGLNRDIVLTTPMTMEDAVANSISGARSVTAVLAMFAAVAIALAALGLYGVLAYFVTRRVHEIGIRVALGASGREVLGLVVTRGMVLVGMGSVLGIAGSLGATRLVEGMLFQISAVDPATYVGVAVFFLILGLGACLIPGWKALRVDPVEAFRAE